MEEYCSLYDRRRGELLHWKTGQGDQDYEYTVYTTWEISLSMIVKISNADAEDAVEILQMFGFLHYDGISEEIFRQAWKGLWTQQHSGWVRSHQLHTLLRHNSSDWEPHLIRKALSLLSPFSLISRDKKSLISIHPLVHAWARDRLSCSEQERFWTLTASTIAISIPWAFHSFDYQFLKSLLPHIDACLGFYDDGIFLLRKLGQDCLNMADKFALTYRENDRRQETLHLVKTVTEARKRTLGEEHPDTLGSIHNLALRYSEVGRRQEALRLTEAVVESSKRTLGEDDPDTLRYSEVGRQQEALQLVEAVVEASKRTLGEEHPDTLGSMHNLKAMKENLNILTESS
jgi:Tetratricopeptide repeat